MSIKITIIPKQYIGSNDWGVVVRKDVGNNTGYIDSPEHFSSEQEVIDVVKAWYNTKERDVVFL